MTFNDRIDQAIAETCRRGEQGYLTRYLTIYAHTISSIELILMLIKKFLGMIYEIFLGHLFDVLLFLSEQA